MSSILPSELGDLILAETSSTANVLVTQNAVEVFGTGDPEIRTTQNAVEVLGTAAPDIRVTQNAVEVFGEGNPDIRTTQNAVEILGSANPDIRVTQIAVEVLAPVAEPPPPEPGFGYGHNFAFHRFHDTGPTNNSIPHSTPLNQYTTGQGIGFRRKPMLGAGMPYTPPPPPHLSPCYNRGWAIYVGGTPFNPSFVVPPGVTSIYIECIGAGADGGTCLGGDETTPGVSGGGGAYAASLVSVTPGDILNINPDPPNGGSASEVTGIVSAQSALFTVGGLATNSTGDITISGQNGQNGTDYPTTGQGGIGGASVLGQGGAGGLPNPVGPGFNGGNGVLLGSGGGGGGYGDSGGCGAGGLGAAGLVKLTWCWGFGHGENPPHQQHNTGSTNNSISHELPLNQWTTTKGIGLRRKWILGTALSAGDNQIPVPLPPFCGITTENDQILNINGRLRRFESASFSTPGLSSFTVPANIYSIYVECIGGGGAGGNGNSAEQEFPGGGGGGGAYAASLLAVNPGDVFQVEVGPGGINPGEDGFTSSFDNPPQVTADYGRWGDTGNGGQGGLAANSIGDVVIDGGDGGDGITTTEPVGGATGGSAAGGGLGGIGGSPNSVGGPGNYPGAGGGGGGSTYGPLGGGSGATGLVRVTWMTYDFGFTGGPNRYPNRRHQTHSTGQTNWSILHCDPLNQWTTTKGISVRNKYLFGEPIPPAPEPPIYKTIRACKCPAYIPPEE